MLATNIADQSSDFDATLAIQQAVKDGAAMANCSWGMDPATDGTPHASGAIALLLQQSPHLSPNQVKTALLRKCVAVATSTPADRGAGLLVIFQSLEATLWYPRRNRMQRIIQTGE